MFLELKDVSVQYGKAIAVQDVSLHMQEGEIVAIVGANGAGKTTIIRMISGLIRPAKGEVWFDGKRIDKLSGADIVKSGIVQVPAGRRILGKMSVLDNLLVGAYLRKDCDEVNRDLERMYEYFPVLGERKSQAGGSLSGGEQQMLAVARALMARPRLILMDEPSVGLSPKLVSEVGELITRINQMGISILLVEQNSKMALRLSNRAYVLEIGKVAHSGDSKVLAEDGDIKNTISVEAEEERGTFVLIRHISVFTFLDHPANGKTKAENIEEVRSYLERVPQLYTPIRRQVIASTLGGTPALPEDAPVMFGDLLQIADYDNAKDANGYPPPKAHMYLVELSAPMMKKVIEI